MWFDTYVHTVYDIFEEKTQIKKKNVWSQATKHLKISQEKYLKVNVNILQSLRFESKCE